MQVFAVSFSCLYKQYCFHNFHIIFYDSCNYTSSQDHRRLTDNQQLLGLSQMGQEAALLVLHQGHHPSHRLCRHLHRMHLWECLLGSRHHQWAVFNLHPLHLRLQMVLRVQYHLHLLVVQWLTLLLEHLRHALRCKATLDPSSRWSECGQERSGYKFWTLA